MLDRLKYYLVLALVAAPLSWSGTVLSAQDQNPSPKQVLAIFVFKQSMPWPYRLEQSMRAALTSDDSYPIKLSVEYADQLTFTKQAYLEKVIELYRYKYKFSDQKMDLVLVLGDESVDLMLEYSQTLFGDVPVVLVTVEKNKIPHNLSKPNMVSFVWGIDLTKTVALVHDLLPKTKNVFVISGSSLTDRKLKNLAVNALSELDDRFTIHHLDDLKLQDILLKVAHLPEDSVILFLTIFQDATGTSYIPRDIVSQVSEKANAPVFSMLDTYLGKGIVGGNLLSAEHQGKKYAEIMIKILKGETVMTSEPMENGHQMMFDWRQLKRWSIDEARLPPDSVVRYREPSILVDHTWEIIGVIAVVFTQFLALIGLTIQYRRRSQAEEVAQNLLDERAHISRALAMGEIAASLAHELNQPLSAIRSYAQAAQRFLGNDPANPDEAYRALEGIVAGNRRAEEVIKRIRKTLKDEPFQLTRLNVRELTQEVKELVKRKAKENDILLRLELAAGLPPLLGDHIQLQQVLFNLIINGVEAMAEEEGHFREIVVCALREKADAVTISVRDSGIGIDDKQSDILFDAFYTTKPEGMGIGLSISRSIIENHGGQLWATSNPDKGTTFSFTVPIYKEDEK